MNSINKFYSFGYGAPPSCIYADGLAQAAQLQSVISMRSGAEAFMRPTFQTRALFSPIMLREASPTFSQRMFHYYSTMLLIEQQRQAIQPIINAFQWPPVPPPSGHTGSTTNDEEAQTDSQKMDDASAPIVCRWLDNQQTCGARFHLLRDLTEHVEGHIQEQTVLRCFWMGCERTHEFSVKYTLKQHIKTHTGDKPCVCKFPNCNKRYSRPEYLKIHYCKHNNEKPYKCTETGCSVAFSNASDRRKHVNRTHFKTKKYICPVELCVKDYTDPSSLRKHICARHGKDAYEIARQNKQRNGACGSYGCILKLNDRWINKSE